MKKIIIIIVVCAIVAGLFYMGIPIVDKYIKKKRTQEARANLKKIYDMEITYYRTEDENGKKYDHFISAPLTPSGKPGKGKRSGNFDHPSWKILKFNPGRVRYSYYVTASGKGRYSKFSAYAMGDLDGDGETSLFERHGIIDPKTGELYGKTSRVTKDIE